MPKTIVLTNLIITSLTYYPVDPRVTVSYQCADAAGRVYESGEAILWATLPVLPEKMTVPSNWYPLPALRATQLTQVTDLAATTLAKLLT